LGKTFAKKGKRCAGNANVPRINGLEAAHLKTGNAGNAAKYALLAHRKRGNAGLKPKQLKEFAFPALPAHLSALFYKWLEQEL
jgi:hypothetical protein